MELIISVSLYHGSIVSETMEDSKLTWQGQQELSAIVWDLIFLLSSEWTRTSL